MCTIISRKLIFTHVLVFHEKYLVLDYLFSVFALHDMKIPNSAFELSHIYKLNFLAQSRMHSHFPNIIDTMADARHQKGAMTYMYM